MVEQFLSDVSFEIDKETITDICNKERVQRKIMKAVIRIIGDNIAANTPELN